MLESESEVRRIVELKRYIFATEPHLYYERTSFVIVVVLFSEVFYVHIKSSTG